VGSASATASASGTSAEARRWIPTETWTRAWRARSTQTWVCGAGTDEPRWWIRNRSTYGSGSTASIWTTTTTTSSGDVSTRSSTPDLPTYPWRRTFFPSPSAFWNPDEPYFEEPTCSPFASTRTWTFCSSSAPTSAATRSSGKTTSNGRSFFCLLAYTVYAICWSWSRTRRSRTLGT
jgi:hypothetical protein